MANGTGILTALKGEEVDEFGDDHHYCHHCESEQASAEYDRWCVMMDLEARVHAIQDQKVERRQRRLQALATSKNHRIDGRNRRDQKLRRQLKAFTPDP
ncbi:hypothetical protein HOI83_01875 [Candidatus Uhrbacteria bacterium]|jgi:hypothetical protein|nr:hypothetical protein [Candidatus Uhrbacteria bacterium]